VDARLATPADPSPQVGGLVSTVIPVFNRPAMLVAAVESVLAQTWGSIEVIVADDGSSDDTPLVAERLAREHPGIVRVVRGQNRGPGPAREAGRLLARGEYIQYLDSDDRLLPQKFELQVRALQASPDCDIAYGMTRLVDEQGGEIAAPFKWTGRDFDALMPGLLIDRWWCTHTPLYRRRLTDRIGAWSAMRWSQDWQYDARAAALGARLVNCHAYVSEHCHHAGVRQTSNADWQRDPVRLRNRLELLDALWRSALAVGVEEAAPERQHFARWAFTIGRQCAAAGLREETDACLRLALMAGGDGAGSRGIRLFSIATRLFGPATAGGIARWLASRRASPGPQTLPQSFSNGSQDR
jgi:GT2 family glycosyltransferase